MLARGADLGEHRARDAEHVEELVVPVARVDVVHQRARGVRDVGDVERAPAKLPQQPAVDRAEGEVAGLGLLARAVDVVEDPPDLGAGEVGVDHEAGLLLEEVGVALVLELVAEAGRAPVLPHDRVVDGLPRLPVPDDRGLALVRDPDGGDVLGGQPLARERLRGDAGLGGPDLVGVVLDPPRLGEDLLELPLRDRLDLAFFVEEDRARAGGALVEGEDVGHGRGGFVKGKGFVRGGAAESAVFTFCCVRQILT